MDNVIKHLSDSQLAKLSKKDKRLLLEIQKDIHDQKTEYYERLKNYYWFVAVMVLATFFLILFKTNNHFFKYEFIGVIIAFILSVCGGKIYFVNKPPIVKKAIAKSKLLDAMEIEAIPSSGNRKRVAALIAVIFGVLIYIAIFVTILLV